jgi:hypothetical protein
MDFATLAVAQNYVDKTAQSLGAVKGAPCTINGRRHNENAVDCADFRLYFPLHD